MDKFYSLEHIKHYKQCLLLVCCLFVLSCYLSCAASETTIESSHDNTMCIEHQKQVLLKFKQGIQVDRCGLLSSWGDHPNCCQWDGVGCNNITGHVIILNLRGVETFSDELCLQGILGSSIGDLKHLRYLDLSFNDFRDQPIPSNIGSLVHLKDLNLSYSLFRGEIPPQFGNLSNLVSLGLGPNIYVKSLSWLSRLTMLRRINLFGVDLTKATIWQQVVTNLPFLRVLDLEDCFLPPLVLKPLSYQNSSATLSIINLSSNHMYDSSIFEWLFSLSGINTHLTHLDLSYNQLGGPLPSSFGSLLALSYLDLSYNSFQGNIPSSFGNMYSLSYLSLSRNKLEGPVSDTISNIKPLAHLDLSFNNFQSLSKTLSNLGSLQELHLNDNNFTDELSIILTNFSSLRILDLSNNLLYGRIPQSLGQLSMMETLDLSCNRLEGILSNIHFSNLFRLRELRLGNNSGLELEVNVDWVPPFQLDLIDLHSCRVGPLFPKWLLSQTNYSCLDISNTGISDTILESFWNSLPSKLYTLNMSHNKLYGTIPSLIKSQLNGLKFPFVKVDLSFNNLEGVIPSFPRNVTSLFLNDNSFSNPIPFLCPKSKSHLYNLDLSNNFLSTKFPDCWIDFPLLSILHLENNNFSGVIPPSISYLKKLESLHLRNNFIFGPLSRSLENLTSMVVLDLGHNFLSGHIPTSFGTSFNRLGILSLQNNNFDGEIPLSLCQMSFLQVLDLSSNHFTGKIPKCTYNFTAMQNGTDNMPKIIYHGLINDFYGYTDAATIMWKRKEWSFEKFLGLVKAIDISNNDLEGEIPIGISMLKGLGSLNLSRNYLIGGISSELGQLTALQILDLSRSQFSGEIPTSFAELNSLGILDLSNNQLVGGIPDIPQFQRFDASAYIGNPRLCGLPLAKCPWNQPRENNPTKGDDNSYNQDEDDSDDIFTVGLYVSVILGFIIGFWGVCGTLVLKRAWRHAFFGFLEDMRDRFSFQF